MAFDPTKIEDKWLEPDEDLVERQGHRPISKKAFYHLKRKLRGRTDTVLPARLIRYPLHRRAAVMAKKGQGIRRNGSEDVFVAEAQNPVEGVLECVTMQTRQDLQDGTVEWTDLEGSTTLIVKIPQDEVVRIYPRGLELARRIAPDEFAISCELDPRQNPKDDTRQISVVKLPTLINTLSPPVRTYRVAYVPWDTQVLPEGFLPTIAVGQLVKRLDADDDRVLSGEVDVVDPDPADAEGVIPGTGHLTLKNVVGLIKRRDLLDFPFADVRVVAVTELEVVSELGDLLDKAANSKAVKMKDHLAARDPDNKKGYKSVLERLVDADEIEA